LREYTCEICKSLRQMARRGRPRRFCPGECARVAKESAIQEWREAGGFDRTREHECERCGAQWCNVGNRKAGRQGPTRYCSTKCGQRTSEEKRNPPLEPFYIECDYCKRLTLRTTRLPAKFCSARCMEAIRGTYRRRARLFGVEYESINKRKVFDRDGWVCGICHGPIARKLEYPDPMSASLDHIVPLSLGGPHLWHNVQAAHLWCNIAKGNRDGCGSQLLLLGVSA
jgi:hypothetical protein